MAEERDNLGKEHDEPEVEDNDVEAHSFGEQGDRANWGEQGDRANWGENGERAKLT